MRSRNLFAIVGFWGVLFAFMAILPQESQAVPALNSDKMITQPDGTSFVARTKGDEFQHWTEETAGGHSIVHNPKSGFWEYAEPSADGSLQGSGVKVDPEGKTAPAHLSPGLKPTRNEGMKGFQKEMLNQIYQERLERSAVDSSIEFAAGDWTPVPVSGPKKVLVILVNFANRALKTTASNWNAVTFSTATGAKSVANYYKQNSFTKMSISPVPHTQNGGANPGLVTVTVADYHPDTQDPTYAVESTWINHALAKAASFVNFAALDTNANGILDTSEVSVYFILAGYEAAGSDKRPYIWAHAWGGSGVSVAGKQLPRWALNGELNDADARSPIGTMIHELGHSLCGLPDLYDTTYTNEGMGIFSLMAAGSWGADSALSEASGTTPTALDAWSRQYLGWTVPKTTKGSFTLNPALSGNAAAVKYVNSALSTTEYFLIENRYPTGWDRGMTIVNNSWNGGLLITHVDITAGTQGQNDLNDYVVGGHQGVVPVQASTASCDMLVANANCAGAPTTLFYNGNKNALSDTTTPNSKYYNGTSSGLSVSNISAPGSSMTFNIVQPCAVPGSIAVPAYDYDGGYTVSWGASPTAGVTYTLQEATNKAFSTGLRTVGSALTGLSANITGRPAGKAYFYRVKAVKTGFSDSAWKTSAAGCYVGTVAGVPASITVPTSDADGVYVVKWGASPLSGVTYQLQEATNSTFTTDVRTAYTGTALTANISGRTTGKTYYYRVKATKTNYTASAWKAAANGCAIVNIGDSFEPDNLYTQANIISLGAIQSRTFNPVGDIDWVKFNCTAYTQVEIFTSGTMDTYMEIYNADGTPITGLYDDDSGLGYNAYVGIACNGYTGPALARVYEYGNNATGSYTLTFRSYTGAASAPSRNFSSSTTISPILRSLDGILK